jgi:hypothetical protein
MHLGFDFDNTIVSYDELFYKVALENGDIPPEVTANKLSVRDYLRANGKENIWIELQGVVYGGRMSEATAYPGVIEVMRWAKDSGIEMSIVSHKTKHPFMGTQYDLHEAATNWIRTHLLMDGELLIPLKNVFFEITKEAKIHRINAVNPNVYVDDLPEILKAPQFSGSILKILFDPDGHHPTETIQRISDWSIMRNAIGFA